MRFEEYFSCAVDVKVDPTSADSRDCSYQYEDVHTLLPRLRDRLLEGFMMGAFGEFVFVRCASLESRAHDHLRGSGVRHRPARPCAATRDHLWRLRRGPALPCAAHVLRATRLVCYLTHRLLNLSPDVGTHARAT